MMIDTLTTRAVHERVRLAALRIATGGDIPATRRKNDELLLLAHPHLGWFDLTDAAALDEAARMLDIRPSDDDLLAAKDSLNLSPLERMVADGWDFDASEVHRQSSTFKGDEQGWLYVTTASCRNPATGETRMMVEIPRPLHHQTCIIDNALHKTVTVWIRPDGKAEVDLSGLEYIGESIALSKETTDRVTLHRKSNFGW